MRLYKLWLLDDEGSDYGPRFFSSERKAKSYRWKKGWPLTNEIQAIEITPTKSGIMAALNDLAGDIRLYWNSANPILYRIGEGPPCENHTLIEPCNQTLGRGDERYCKQCRKGD
jgi:hypothetical protein